MKLFSRKKQKSESSTQIRRENTPLVLAILDGFGVGYDSPQSSWASAHLPTFEHLASLYPFTALAASGISVGLAWDEEGNSEVGHLTMGAGRIPYQHSTQIDNSIRDGSFFTKPALADIESHIRNTNGSLHIIGLLSSGGVHSRREHLIALLNWGKQKNIPRIFLHLFTDGKDAPENEGVKMVADLEALCQKQYPMARIASISGRNFGMDRDDNWDRTKKAYDVLCGSVERSFNSPFSYIQEQYGRGVFDASLEPATSVDDGGSPIGAIKNGDALLFFNFREDSMRQLVAAFVIDNFQGFSRVSVSNLKVATMTLYYKKFNALPIFSPPPVDMPLSQILAENNLRQLHIAETVKYAHVSYFFNGIREEKFTQEEQILIPSLKVKSFAEAPEMSASQITEKIINGLDVFDFIVANYANADVVGHTGNFDATVRALEVLDEQIKTLADAVLAKNGTLIVTADHGNAEEKRYAHSGLPKSKHSANPVPFYLIQQGLELKERRSPQDVRSAYSQVNGMLADIAPTVLELLHIPQPPQMTGISLLPKLLTMNESKGI